jgi:hypothetical protein
MLLLGVGNSDKREVVTTGLEAQSSTAAIESHYVRTDHESYKLLTIESLY